MVRRAHRRGAGAVAEGNATITFDMGRVATHGMGAHASGLSQETCPGALPDTTRH